MTTIHTWQLIDESLQKDIPLMLLYVLESKGSSPGRQGFCMAVNAHGEMEGSIGGGIMEHKFVQMAIEELQASVSMPTARVQKQVHDKKDGKNRSGMICSGEQTILLCTITKKEQPVIQQIITSLQQQKNGTLTLKQDAIDFNNEVPVKDFYFKMRTEEDWIYQEKTGFKNRLYIIGGGHCALALSKLMSGMDFYIELFEERRNLNTVVRNVFAHKKTELDNYAELKDHIRSGSSHYFVIMTFGYRTDDIALRALLQKDLKYLGLLGSRKKIEQMFNILRAEGINDALLSSIHAPVGINIKSETPEEIAVSIAAEIIRTKNGEWQMEYGE